MSAAPADGIDTLSLSTEGGRPPQPPLPEGWRARWAPYDRKYSYVHVATGYVQWGYPDEKKVAELANRNTTTSPSKPTSPPAVKIAASPLPPPPAETARADPLATFDTLGGWSGRGQHVEFARNEKIPLEEGRALGRGASADVHEVTCQGETLARKQIYCSRRLKIEDVKRELEILKKIKHRHVVTLVGSYTQRNVLGLLLFPAAVCDLGMFLDELDDEQRLSGETIGEGLSNLMERLELTPQTLDSARTRVCRAYGCLTSAVQYLHDNDIRHKDLKPRNVLLDRNYGLFVTDFGLSRDTTDASTSVTHGIERGTYKYCAPEVARYEPRGRAADIYSLGCVFLEMDTVYRGLSLVEFDNSRSETDDHSFQNSPGKLRDWMSKLRDSKRPLEEDTGVFDIVDLVEKMLDEDPMKRPIIKHVASSLKLLGDSFYHGSCCAKPLAPMEDFKELRYKYIKVKALYFDQQDTIGKLRNELAEAQTKLAATRGDDTITNSLLDQVRQLQAKLTQKESVIRELDDDLRGMSKTASYYDRKSRT